MITPLNDDHSAAIAEFYNSHPVRKEVPPTIQKDKDGGLIYPLYCFSCLEPLPPKNEQVGDIPMRWCSNECRDDYCKRKKL